MMLKQCLWAACLAVSLAAVAADKQTTQQQKMAACNKEAGDKKLAGDERKAFMSQCLSAEGVPAGDKKMTQQEKMGSSLQQGRPASARAQLTASRRTS